MTLDRMGWRGSPTGELLFDHAVEIHDGNGFMWETEVNCLYRAAKLIEIGAGTTQVRQLIIAQELLKD